MERDRFGNTFASELPYARGDILSSTDEDFRKLTRAWRTIERRIREQGKESLFNFAEAVDASLSKLACIIGEPENIRSLLLGEGERK